MATREIAAARRESVLDSIRCPPVYRSHSPVAESAFMSLCPSPRTALSCANRIGFARLLVGSSLLSLGLLGGPGAKAQDPVHPKGDITVYVSLRARNKSVPAVTTEQLEILDAGTAIDRKDVQVTSSAASQEPVVSVLFDHMNARNMKSSAQMALDLLPRLSDGTFKVGVWGILSRLHGVQPYTASLSEAEQSIKRYEASASTARDPGIPGSDTTGLSPSDPWLNSVEASAAQWVFEKHVSWTYAAVLAMAQQQKKRTGRGAILLFTEQQEFEGSSPERYRALLEQLRGGNTLLYVIDANVRDDRAREQMIISTAMGAQGASNYYGSLAGQHSSAPNAATLGLPPLQYARMRDTIADIQMDALGETSNALFELAKGSGGASAFTGDSTRRLGRELVNALTHYTTLSFTPPTTGSDGRFHAVSVKTLAPGIVIADQPGYFARPRPRQNQAIATGTRSVALPIPESRAGVSGASVVSNHPAVASLDEITDPLADIAFVEAKALENEAGLTLRTDLSLSPEQSENLLRGARETSLAYAENLPNFMCQESISRSVDGAGDGEWKLRDAILENLEFQDGTERRSVLKVNGEKSSITTDLIEGTRSNGEFGNLLKLVFEPSAGAKLIWVKAEQRNREVFQVFRFEVEAARSQFLLKDRSNAQMRAGIHGLLYLDPASHAVRRLFLQTDPLPRTFDVRSSWLVMNYDYIHINGRDYLLPSHGEVGLIQGKHQIFLMRSASAPTTASAPTPAFASMERVIVSNRRCFDPNWPLACPRPTCRYWIQAGVPLRHGSQVRSGRLKLSPLRGFPPDGPATLPGRLQYPGLRSLSCRIPPADRLPIRTSCVSPPPRRPGLRG